LATAFSGISKEAPDAANYCRRCLLADSRRLRDLSKAETSRSATEEMLLSSAADRAAEAIGKSKPRDSKLYFDTSEFTATDDKYAIGAIRDALLRHGNRLVDKRSDAAVVVEIRSGALATDDRETLVGIPSVTIPLPLTAHGD
jgi:hypothetical protein